MDNFSLNTHPQLIWGKRIARKRVSARASGGAGGRAQGSRQYMKNLPPTQKSPKPPPARHNPPVEFNPYPNSLPKNLTMRFKPNPISYDVRIPSRRRRPKLGGARRGTPERGRARRAPQATYLAGGTFRRWGPSNWRLGRRRIRNAARSRDAAPARQRDCDVAAQFARSRRAPHFRMPWIVDVSVGEVPAAPCHSRIKPSSEICTVGGFPWLSAPQIYKYKQKKKATSDQTHKETGREIHNATLDAVSAHGRLKAPKSDVCPAGGGDNGPYCKMTAPLK